MSIPDLKPEDIKKDGTFTDKDGTEQLAVPLSSIFQMVGGKPAKPSGVPKVHGNPIGGKKSPKRGIHTKKK